MLQNYRIAKLYGLELEAMFNFFFISCVAEQKYIAKLLIEVTQSLRPWNFYCEFNNRAKID